MDGNGVAEMVECCWFARSRFSPDCGGVPQTKGKTNTLIVVIIC